jgi:hypothetical protein
MIGFLLEREHPPTESAIKTLINIIGIARRLFIDFLFLVYDVTIILKEKPPKIHKTLVRVTLQFR